MALLACARNQSRSQHLEDLRPAGSSGRPGTFVELGAYTGVSLSNTFMIEACFSWSGLLIEGNPSSFAILFGNAALRRRATLVHSAICARGSVVNMSVHGDGMAADVSTMDRRRWEKYRPRLSYSWERRAARTEGVAAAPVAAVPCAPLAALMTRWGRERATFLSLDVEGAEELVLQTVDPGAFDIILVEQDGLNPQRDAAVTASIRSAGLQRVTSHSVTNSGVFAAARLCDRRDNHTAASSRAVRTCGTVCQPDRFRPSAGVLDRWMRHPVVCV